jgi:hypothetical protein
VLQVVLVLGLRLPERPRGRDLGHHLAGPQTGGLDVGDGVLGHPLLLVVDVEDRRAVAQPDIVALAVLRRRVVDLEEELEDVAVGVTLGSKVISIASAWVPWLRYVALATSPPVYPTPTASARSG